jgi:hypothetical protein
VPRKEESPKFEESTQGARGFLADQFFTPTRACPEDQVFTRRGGLAVWGRQDPWQGLFVAGKKRDRQAFPGREPFPIGNLEPDAAALFRLELHVAPRAVMPRVIHRRYLHVRFAERLVWNQVDHAIGQLDVEPEIEQLSCQGCRPCGFVLTPGRELLFEDVLPELANHVRYAGFRRDGWNQVDRTRENIRVRDRITFAFRDAIRPVGVGLFSGDGESRSLNHHQ